MFNVNQWINWQAVDVAGEVKPRKVPSNGVDQITFDGTNIIGGINAHNPNNWVDYQTASSRSTLYGFVFTENDPYFVIDIDHALQSDGTWSDVALAICNMFPGAYMEVSYSGDGLHIIAQGVLPEGFKHKNQVLGLEVYDRARYIAITRSGEMGSAEINHQAALNLFLSSYMEPTAGTANLSEWTTTPRADWVGPDDDDELIEKMLASRPSANALWGGTATLQDLWTGNTQALIDSYPDGNGGYDESSPDMALATHLGFWTGNNCERIERLMWRSALKRDKWTEHKTYLKNFTIKKAVGLCQKVYKDPRRSVEVEPTTPVAADANIGVARVGYQFLTIDQQLEYFKGCVYVRDTHRVLIPDGSMLNAEQFKATYGGYDFSMDDQALKTSKCAWEIFTKSRGATFPKVVSLAFRPELEPGLIFHEEGRSVINSFQPVPVHRIKGDASPFLGLINKLFPNESDRSIILAYAAACVQHIGTKFQWTPIVQGAEGNGKSLIMRALSYAVGKRLSHFPNPDDISNKFNAWIEGKAFIGIEEIQVSDKRDAINTLKILITNDRLEIQAKGGNQYLGDNRANFWMCSNHMDAVRKTVNDRRYANFFTPQQKYADILRDGMGGEYFPNLYKWLNADGYAIVAEFLNTYEIPDKLNPATLCHRAPVTSSTAMAIEASLGPVEQEILNAIDENLPGFRNGWVSAMELDRLLIKTGKARMIPRNRRAEILDGLGFKKICRTTREILQEGGRPTLFAKEGFVIDHTDPSSQYIIDQGYVVP